MRSCKTRKTRCIVSIIIVILVIIIAFGLIKSTVSHNITQNSLCFEETCIEYEIADTSIARGKGLMYRTSLDEDKGMLFLFETVGMHPFWMKNTLIPLDIIRLDENYKVVYIQHNTQPCEADPCPSYNLEVSSKYALEINGGMAERMKLKIGNQLTLK